MTHQPMATTSHTSSVYSDMYVRVRALLDSPDALFTPSTMPTNTNPTWSARDKCLLDPTSSATDLALASASLSAATGGPTAAPEGVCPLEAPKHFAPSIGAHLTAMTLSSLPTASSADVAAAATFLGNLNDPDAPPLSPTSAVAKPSYLDPLFAALSAASASSATTSPTALPHGHAPRPCGRVFKKADIVYRCATCAMDSTCVLCAGCYEVQKQQHEGHDVYVHSSSGGGCCDCGDEEAWKRELHCPLHGTCNLGKEAKQPVRSQQQPQACLSLSDGSCVDLSGSGAGSLRR